MTFKPEKHISSLCQFGKVPFDAMTAMQRFDCDYKVNDLIDPMVLICWREVSDDGMTALFEGTMVYGTYTPIAFAYMVGPVDKMVFVRLCYHPYAEEGLGWFLGLIRSSVTSCPHVFESLQLITCNDDLVESMRVFESEWVEGRDLFADGSVLRSDFFTYTFELA